jgi:hypothetical protein
MDTQGYQGDLYAGLTPEQLATIQSALGMSGLVPGAVESAFGLGQSMLAGDFLNPETNPYLQNYMDAAARGVTENYQQNVLPSLASGAVMSGGYGGSRQGIAEGLASTGYTQNVGDMLSSILMQNYTQERQNQMNTPAFLASALGFGQQGLDMGYQAGGMLQADNQAKLTEDYTKWQMGQAAPWEAMAPFWGMLTQAGGMGGSASGTFNRAQNPWAGAIGGGLLGWQMQQGNQQGSGNNYGGGASPWLNSQSPANQPFGLTQTPEFRYP